MIRAKKITVICLLMVPLVIIGILGWQFIEANEKYDLNYLILKYPTLADLKKAVDSGEVDYTKLPNKAKKLLDDYTEIKEIKPSDSNYIEMKP